MMVKSLSLLEPHVLTDGAFQKLTTRGRVMLGKWTQFGINCARHALFIYLFLLHILNA